MEFLFIKYPDVQKLELFLSQSGKSRQTFRYFEKRPLTVLQDHVCTILLEENGHIVAYGHLDKEKDKIWLGISVAEAFQGRGYGNQMMNKLIETAKKYQIYTIHLSVDDTNIKAQSMYEKYGFKKQTHLHGILFYCLNLSDEIRR